MIIQIILISKEGRRPLSALVGVQDWADYTANKEKYQTKGIMKIIASRGISTRELKAYGYDTIQIKPYNKERAAQQEADRYTAKVKGNIIT